MKEHVGTDHLGNKYYYIPEQKTWTGKLKSSVTTATCLTQLHQTSKCLLIGIQMYNLFTGGVVKASCENLHVIVQLEQNAVLDI